MKKRQHRQQEDEGMFCKECGELISEDSKFCKHCGALQDEGDQINSDENTPEKQSKIKDTMKTIGENVLDQIGTALGAASIDATTKVLKSAGIVKKTPLEKVEDRIKKYSKSRERSKKKDKKRVSEK